MSKIFNKVIILLFLFVSLLTITGCKKKIKFNVNFYIDNQIYEVVGTNGKEVIEMPTNPTKDGYTFEGWYWDEGTWLKPFTAQSLVQTPLKEDMNVYAYFLDEDSPRGTDLKFKDGVLVEHDGIGDTYLVFVSNNTITFSFSDYVEISNKSTWSVSTDVSGNNTIASKTVELEVGTNLFFVQVFDNETNKVKQYNIGVRRHPIFTVYFNTNGGTSCEMQRVEEDSLVDEPTTSKTGYTFAGWDYDFNTPLKSDLVINANWSPNQYTLSFDANGGTLLNNTMKVIYDKAYTLPTPYKVGHTFNGWYENNNKISDGTWKKTSDLTLVAKWTTNTYNIEYNLNGGTINLSKPSSYTYGTKMVIPNPTKIGYEFIGWTVNQSTEYYKDYEISNATYGDLELVANYKPNVYTITLDSNGGTCDKSYITVEYNSKFELPVPARLGYTFNGWYSGSSKVENGTWTKTSSLDLKAKWSVTNYKITYNLDGATNSLNNPSSYTFETTKIILEDPLKTGYIFIGWTTNENQTPMLNVEIAKGSYGDKKFTANFTPNKYKVTFDVNTGSDLEESVLEYTYNNSYTLPTPTKTGYTFDGWYNGDTKVGSGKWIISEDIALTAKWSIINYAITYNLNGGVNSNSNYTTYNYEYDDITIINPTKSGYTFTGWKVNGNDELVKELVIKHNSTGNIVLNANFIPNSYKLSLDVNGGENLSISSYEINYDDKFELPIPIRIGYEFDGWYNGTTKINSGTWKYLNDLELTAKWNIINYNINYELDGGENSEYNPLTYTYDDETIILSDPYKKGHKFIGWITDEVFIPTSALEVQHNSIGDFTFIAVFEVNTYLITFDVNGGDPLNEMEVVYGEYVELPLPTNDWRIFEGWYLDDDIVVNSLWYIDDNVTLIARWNGTLYSEGGKTYVNLGRYPQTVVTDSNIISKLNNITTTNSLGYIEYLGAEYKKVTASPYYRNDTFINGNSIINGSTYYFKVEPIKWRVLQNTNGTYKLLSEYILDNMYYYVNTNNREVNGKIVYANNYMYSNVRAWLNGLNGSSYNVSNYTGKGFLDIAFTEAERNFINTTLVDNSASTTSSSSNSCACSDTNDKVYLLSYKDMLNTSFGFNSNNSVDDTNRYATVTDYAISKGCCMSTRSSYYGNGYWWLRSPTYGDSGFACEVNDHGYLSSYYVYSSYVGVRPALEITI